MKKKKLTLSRETILRLQTETLSRAVGGARTPSEGEDGPCITYAANSCTPEQGCWYQTQYCYSSPTC
jgi:hypothetical protein